MSKKDLIDAVARDCELTKEKAGSVVDAVLAHIRGAMKEGHEVRIPFFSWYYRSKTSLNPILAFKVCSNDVFVTYLVNIMS